MHGSARIAQEVQREGRREAPLELAVSAGYRAAQVDLANLLVGASAGVLNPERAVVLDQKARKDGVPIAAYLLGSGYEACIAGSRPDLAITWDCIRKGQTRAYLTISRFAERAERQALAEIDPQ